MDLKKTGDLISQRRKDLGLTQKTLADKLCISDRTVSKWERGAGFPDVSLMEPLADALNLTVLELLHGQLEAPAPEQESSAREVLNYCRPQMEEKANRARRWIILLGILLALVLIFLPLIVSTAQGAWENQQSISAEDAVKITPNILITSEDYALLEAVLENETVHDVYTTSFAPSVFLTDESCSEYLKLVEINGETPLFLDGWVSAFHLEVKYGTQHTFVALNIDDGVVTKTVIMTEYPYLTDDGQNIPMGQRHGNRIDLINTDNKTFWRSGYKTGWLELFRTTYY